MARFLKLDVGPITFSVLIGDLCLRESRVGEVLGDVLPDRSDAQPKFPWGPPFGTLIWRCVNFLRVMSYSGTIGQL